MKNCSRCQKRKRLSSFHFNSNTRDGRQTVCKDCAKEVALEHYYANWDRHKENRTKRRSGLSVAELPKVCAICGSSALLKMDHNHKTDLFRDMLCNSCNLGLGMFKDDPALLEAAAAYLRLHAREAG